MMMEESGVLKTDEIEKWKDAFITAHANGALKPVLADGYSDLTLDDAYKVQKALVSELAHSDPISGFKAAVSSRAAQKARGIDTPLYGVLFQSGEYRTGKILDTGRFGKCLLETEIGYRLLASISEVPAPGEVRSLVTAIPMLEFPDAGFDKPDHMGTFDLVAGNSASASYMVGQAATEIEPDEVVVSLYRDGEKAYEGKGSDAMDNQWNAVGWLIQQIIEAGYKIKEGQYLMTGSLGMPLPCIPGKYVADYGSFGRIEFEAV